MWNIKVFLDTLGPDGATASVGTRRVESGLRVYGTTPARVFFPGCSARSHEFEGAAAPRGRASKVQVANLLVCVCVCVCVYYCRT
jgi:hypothetical protein